MIKIVALIIVFTSLCFGSDLEITIPTDNYLKNDSLLVSSNINEWEKHRFEGNLLTNSPINISQYYLNTNISSNGIFNNPLDAILSWHYLLQTNTPNNVDLFKRLFSSYDSDAKILSRIFDETGNQIKSIQPILTIRNLGGVDLIYFYQIKCNNGFEIVAWNSFLKKGSGYILIKNDTVFTSAPIINNLYCALDYIYSGSTNSVLIKEIK